MKLWILTVNEGSGGRYDSYLGHVIRAETSADARRMANEIYGSEGKVWHDDRKTSCEELTAEGEPDIVMSDYIGTNPFDAPGS